LIKLKHINDFYLLYILLYIYIFIYYKYRELRVILDLYEKGKPFFLYTGIVPSTENMHTGHLIPFIFCKY